VSVDGQLQAEWAAISIALFPKAVNGGWAGWAASGRWRHEPPFGWR